jgi:hypothetical protein
LYFFLTYSALKNLEKQHRLKGDLCPINNVYLKDKFVLFKQSAINYLAISGSIENNINRQLFVMDVIKLKTFYTVALLGSFSRAAEKLFFTQPAISSQIKELENEYNTTLFERIGRNIRLTEEGKALLPYAESIFKSFIESQFSVYRFSPFHRSRRRSLAVG